MRTITLSPGSCLFLEHQWHTFGSLALPVRDRAGALCLLTAAHVVGGMVRHRHESGRVCTSHFWQPSPTMQLYVGRVVDSCPPAPADVCVVDAALVRPESGVHATRRLTQDVEAIGIGCDLDLDTMMDRRVWKAGCTSGLTSGIICAVGTSVKVQSMTGTVRYECVYEVMSDSDGVAFAQPGDSGAVVVDGKGWVIGMVVAMQLPTADPSSIACVTPIDLIVRELGIRLVGAR